MSWINDIAGRAEDFLNKIDHGAASVLSKEKKKKKNKINQIIIDNIASEQTIIKAKYSPPLTKKLPLQSTVIHEDRNILSTAGNDDENILNYLNNSEIDIDSLRKLSEDKEPSLDAVESPQLSIVVEESSAELINQSRNDENQLLRNEVRSLNSEVSLLLARTKSSERELALVKSLLTKKESDSVVLEKEILSLKQRLNSIETENAELYEENLSLKQCCKSDNDERSELSLESKLSELELQAQRKEESLKADIASLRIRINELEQSLLKEKNESAKELAEVNARLSEERKELADYRAKAQWTLAEKEKLINALRKEENDPDSGDLHSLELTQLREERGKLIDELEEVRNKLETSRKHELEAERRLESAREEANAALRSAQGRLAEETARRLAAEEHSTSHAEELHSVREELWRQVGSLNSRLKERERELTRLRRQLSERVVTRPEPELTAALVQKQEAIEVLTMEINQLRLQLERVKLSHVQDCRGVNVNDTDDAKAQVPMMMVRSRFERGLRRVCLCIDAVGRRFLQRRHPLFRLGVFTYLVALHVWLCIVLFSYTPDTHLNV